MSCLSCGQCSATMPHPSWSAHARSKIPACRGFPNSTRRGRVCEVSSGVQTPNKGKLKKKLRG